MSKFEKSRLASLLADFFVHSSDRALPGRHGQDGNFDTWNPRAISQSCQSAFALCGVMADAREDSKYAGCETTGSMEQTNHPWNTLETITTFDQGTSNNTNSTICVDNDIQNNGKVVPQTGHQVTQATGVLIESLLQQLCAMLEGDKDRRNKLYNDICKKLYDLQLINDTYNTAEFDVLRARYQSAFYRMLTVARAQPESENVLSIPKLFLMPRLFRYHEEFQEICFIARGGFGEVYKALHRLDGIKYAVKKIAIPVDRIEMMQQQMNEVRTLAKLKHPNIVSYNAAWIEPLPSYTSNASSTNHKSSQYHTSKYHKKNSKSSSLDIKDLFDDKYNLNPNKSKLHNKHDILFNIKVSCTTDTDIRTKKHNKIHRNTDSNINHDTISVRFEELDSSTNLMEEKIVKENIEECTEEFSSDIVSFRNSKSNENLDEAIVNTDTSNSSSCEESNREVCIYTSNKNKSFYILYIQMALCEQTLEQWLRGKISVTPEPIVKAVFQQIVCGVDYIHSQKIVHHDIKPSNIFISTTGQLQIQLGDFGLACPLQKEHHSAVGTHVYAAPEQLEGKCDPKSDIYSIGVVLVELLISIKTRMELAYIIGSLKSDEIPEALKQHKWAQLVKQLVQTNPAKRPSTSQLLQDLNHDKDATINRLKDIIVHLENDNHIKDGKIQDLLQEIALLKEKLSVK
ncbi:eukaryotic translation initiation factor 2-alpha kinase 1 isoform X2 [Solenopsis invicta]|uniref:eukaryotic translation initiation factor 2-alpha kinase 1 isoform X2 n=1 Tax=Solenopsis invicta TaxID=13686 RepID=UPI00193E4801|nr:eukaryotic translation initiation factor 2-alpha kinase 1 isoform X2 [Solenopsis invicta]